MNIRVEFGKPYAGFGAAHPCKSREERAQELRSYMPTDFCLDLLVVLASQAAGYPFLPRPVPPGTTATRLIERILNHEYPNG